MDREVVQDAVRQVRWRTAGVTARRQVRPGRFAGAALMALCGTFLLVTPAMGAGHDDPSSRGQASGQADPADDGDGDWVEVWTYVSSGPLPRQATCSATDEEQKRMFLFGGFGARLDTDFFNDLWMLQVAPDDAFSVTWSDIGKDSDSVPGTRASASLDHIVSLNSLYTFGGTTRRSPAGGLTDLDDLWKFDLAAMSWSEVSPSSPDRPVARNEHVTCSRGDSLFVFGGLSMAGNKVTALGDTWQFHAGMNVWKELTPSTSPPARFSHVGVWVTDVLATLPHQPMRTLRGASTTSQLSGRRLAPSNTSQGSLVIVGGRYDDAIGQRWNMLEDLWSMKFDDAADDHGFAPGVFASITWVEQAVGVPHFGRAYHAGVGWGNKAAIFGGYMRYAAADEPVQGLVFNDLLSNGVPTDGGVWQKAVVSATKAPPVRFDHTAARIGEVIYVYGGRFQRLEPSMHAINSSAVQWRDVTEDDFIAGKSVSGFLGSAHFMIGVLTMMMLCFCGFLVSLRQNSRRAREQAFAVPVRVEHPARPVGTSEQVRREIPLVKIGGSRGGAEACGGASTTDDFVSQQATCSICLCDYEAEESVNELPCGHRYHPPCIQQWLKTSSLCPLCKVDVVTGEPSS